MPPQGEDPDIGRRCAYKALESVRSKLGQERRITMGTTKKVTKKSKGLKRGKSLETVKTLTKGKAPAPTTTTTTLPTDQVSLNYSKIEWSY
jgi:hypothetical protein